MGAGRMRIFWQITFPLSLPGVFAGVLLVVVRSMGQYAVPALLGGRQDMMMANLDPLPYRRRARLEHGGGDLGGPDRRYRASSCCSLGAYAPDAQRAGALRRWYPQLKAAVSSGGQALGRHRVAAWLGAVLPDAAEPRRHSDVVRRRTTCSCFRRAAFRFISTRSSSSPATGCETTLLSLRVALVSTLLALLLGSAAAYGLVRATVSRQAAGHGRAPQPDVRARAS